MPSSSQLATSLAASVLPSPDAALSIGQHLAYVERMVERGGPTPEEYASFDRWLAHVAADLRAGRMSEGELRTLHESFGRALSLETNQGLSLRKPHGYPGDYEIIDRIYREHTTDDPTLRNWDLYFHTQAAPRAVRNRKAYFVGLLEALLKGSSRADMLSVLNVASGPARDIFEFFEGSGYDDRVQFECVDSDSAAIAYARRLCGPYLDRIVFRQANALRFTSERRFRLVWSAGLFDYFGDDGFKFLLRRLLDMLDEEGELVIGNFSQENATRDYMEVMGDWNLYHRSEDELRSLAEACGVADEDVRIGREPEAVNLFLHVKRGSTFIDLPAPALRRRDRRLGVPITNPRRR
ncbi:MAG: class I SAM-dependent methyltransferase [Rhodothermales bacterium]